MKRLSAVCIAVLLCAALSSCGQNKDIAQNTTHAAKTSVASTVTEATLTQCEHNYTQADCILPETCLLCGETRGEALGHDYADATCTKPETCLLCGETRGEALGHDYADATCTKPETCRRCGDTRGKKLGHIVNDEPTCTEPAHCECCGAAVKKALGHDFTDASCLRGSFCRRCWTGGEDALGHDFSVATCTKPKTCKRCSLTIGFALGHDFENDVCTRCRVKQFTTDSSFEQEVFRLVNDERAKAGLAALEWSDTLCAAAHIRVRESADLFSHTRPDGTKCDTVNELADGENIAKGYPTPEETVQAWMDSNGHRENILRSTFKISGVGTIRKINGVVYCTLLFGRHK